MKKSSGFLVITFLLFFISDEAYAYLDPGTGSMIVQAVIAGVAAVSVSIGIFRRRLLSFWGRFFGQKNSKKDDRDDR
jgi:hypothetical protein